MYEGLEDTVLITLPDHALLRWGAMAVMKKKRAY
jgi:hypothetical protein